MENEGKDICENMTDMDGKNNSNTLPCPKICVDKHIFIHGKLLHPTLLIYLEESCNLGLDANTVAELGHMMGHWKLTLINVRVFKIKFCPSYTNYHYSYIKM